MTIDEAAIKPCPLKEEVAKEAIKQCFPGGGIPSSGDSDIYNLDTGNLMALAQVAIHLWQARAESARAPAASGDVERVAAAVAPHIPGNMLGSRGGQEAKKRNHERICRQIAESVLAAMQPAQVDVGGEYIVVITDDGRLKHKFCVIHNGETRYVCSTKTLEDAELIAVALNTYTAAWNLTPTPDAAKDGV